MVYLEEQLRFLHFLQEHRGSTIKPILLLLNFFDSSIFITLLVIFVWIGCSWRWGIRLAFLMVFSGILNYLMKTAFELPRPILFDPTLPIAHATGYGFPSGGAQNAFLLGGLLITYWKNRWAWLAGGLFAFCVAFSRMYLGVHFPIDVLGGIFLGLLLLFSFIKLMPLIEQKTSRHPLGFLVAVLLITGSFFLVGSLRLKAIAFSGFTFSLGIFLSCRYGLYFAPPKSWKENLILGAFGVLSSYALGTLFSECLFLYTLSVGLWVSLIASPLCKALYPPLRS